MDYSSAAPCQTRSRQSGLSLMEIGLVFLVIAIVVIGIVSIYRNANSSAQISTERQNLQAVATATKEMYGTSLDYGTSDITAALVTNRAVPQPMIVGTALRNGWNGNVTVTGNSDTFTIQETNVPRKECATLSQTALEPVAVRINGAAQTIPLVAAAAVSACNGATNTIAWDVR